VGGSGKDSLSQNSWDDSLRAGEDPTLARCLRVDVFELHKKLPAGLLTVPYNFITSLMRKNLMEKVDHTLDINTGNFFIQKDNLDETWDIYAIVYKK
jgi:hypothetical protein